MRSYNSLPTTESRQLTFDDYIAFKQKLDDWENAQSFLDSNLDLDWDLKLADSFFIRYFISCFQPSETHVGKAIKNAFTIIKYLDKKESPEMEDLESPSLKLQEKYKLRTDEGVDNKKYIDLDFENVRRIFKIRVHQFLYFIPFLLRYSIPSPFASSSELKDVRYAYDHKFLRKYVLFPNSPMIKEFLSLHPLTPAELSSTKYNEHRLDIEQAFHSEVIGHFISPDSLFSRLKEIFLKSIYKELTQALKNNNEIQLTRCDLTLILNRLILFFFPDKKLIEICDKLNSIQETVFQLLNDLNLQDLEENCKYIIDLINNMLSGLPDNIIIFLNEKKIDQEPKEQQKKSPVDTFLNISQAAIDKITNYKLSNNISSSVNENEIKEISHIDILKEIYANAIDEISDYIERKALLKRSLKKETASNNKANHFKSFWQSDSNKDSFKWSDLTTITTGMNKAIKTLADQWVIDKQSFQLQYILLRMATDLEMTNKIKHFMKTGSASTKQQLRPIWEAFINAISIPENIHYTWITAIADKRIFIHRLINLEDLKKITPKMKDALQVLVAKNIIENEASFTPNDLIFLRMVTDPAITNKIKDLMEMEIDLDSTKKQLQLIWDAFIDAISNPENIHYEWVTTIADKRLFIHSFINPEYLREITPKMEWALRVIEKMFTENWKSFKSHDLVLLRMVTDPDITNRIKYLLKNPSPTNDKLQTYWVAFIDAISNENNENYNWVHMVADKRIFIHHYTNKKAVKDSLKGYDYDLVSMSPEIKKAQKKPEIGKLYVELEGGVIKYIADGMKTCDIIEKNECSAPISQNFSELQKIKHKILDIASKRGHIPLMSLMLPDETQLAMDFLNPINAHWDDDAIMILNAILFPSTLEKMNTENSTSHSTHRTLIAEKKRLCKAEIHAALENKSSNHWLSKAIVFIESGNSFQDKYKKIAGMFLAYYSEHFLPTFEGLADFIPHQ